MKTLAVVMPTYNSRQYLRESIDSLLKQTWTDFDLYIFDDGSNDNSFEVIESFEDDRIIYYANESNIGIAATLNKAIFSLANQYTYIARMDADDYCFPERFQKQLDFLDVNTEYVMCGTQGYWQKDLSSDPESAWEYPETSGYLNYYLLFAASFGHSAVMFRSELFLQNPDLKYNTSIQTCEDWDLWCRIIKYGPVSNLPEFLMKYRIVSGSNHRAPEKVELHLRERSAIISNHYQTFGISVSADQIYTLYYSGDRHKSEYFRSNLKVNIEIFNKVYKHAQSSLPKRELDSLRYMMARKLLAFWKRNGQSRFNLSVWIDIIRQTQFINKLHLIKSLIR